MQFIHFIYNNWEIRKTVFFCTICLCFLINLDWRAENPFVGIQFSSGRREHTHTHTSKPAATHKCYVEQIMRKGNVFQLNQLCVGLICVYYICVMTIFYIYIYVPADDDGIIFIFILFHSFFLYSFEDLSNCNYN